MDRTYYILLPFCHDLCAITMMMHIEDAVGIIVGIRCKFASFVSNMNVQYNCV